MASGVTHLWIMALLSFSLFAGGVLVDLDHYKTHSIKEMARSFLGDAKYEERDDTKHFFHNPKNYKAIFLGVGMFALFAIGLFIHLKLDKII